MDTETRKKVAYDLTMECIKQSRMLYSCNNNIPSKVEEIEKLYNSFYESLGGKNIL